MGNFKITVNVEPTNDYQKAKQDLIKALNSVRALPIYQQEQLVKEVFGVQIVAEYIRMIQQYRG